MRRIAQVLTVGLALLLLLGAIGYATGKSEAMVIGIASTVRSLDPATRISDEEARLIMQMYDTLLTYDRTDYNRLAPSLAERWEVKDNGLTWILYLRKGVKFSSGNVLTADDVVYTYLRGKEINNPGSLFDRKFKQYLLDDWNQAIAKVDDYTVRLRLKEPFAVFGTLLTNLDAAIIDSKALKQHISADDPHGTKYLNDHSLGSGPFVLKDWKRDQAVTMVKNGAYWGIPINYFRVPKYDTLINRNVPEAGVQKMMLDRGEIQMAWNLTGDMIAGYLKDPNFYVTTIPIFIATGIIMNPASGILSDENVRNAIRWAIDYDSIVKDIFVGYALRLDRPFFTPFLGSRKPGAPFLYSYDIQKAKDYLQRSSYPNGGQITLVIGNGGGMGAPWEIIAQKEASDLAKIGITAKIEQYDWAVVDEKTESGKYEALQFWTGCSMPEAAGNVSSSAHTTKSYYLRPIPAAANQAIDALCDQADVVADPQQREQLYNQVSELHARVGPYVNVAQQIMPFVFPANVKGFDGYPDTSSFDYAALYYVK